MKYGSRIIDHIVFAFPKLPEGIQFFQEKLGVTASYGGKHPNHGTHNALIKIDSETYLEIIARDPDHNLQTPTWMGIDNLNEPKIVRWALKSKDINEDASLLRKHDPKMGEIVQGERQTKEGGTLRWEMTLPLALPEVELIPFFTDWSKSDSHPCDNLEPVIQISDLELTHPTPEKMSSYFNAAIGINLTKSGDKARISMKFIGPKATILI